MSIDKSLESSDFYTARICDDVIGLWQAYVSRSHSVYERRYNCSSIGLDYGVLFELQVVSPYALSRICYAYARLSCRWRVRLSVCHTLVLSQN